MSRKRRSGAFFKKGATSSFSSRDLISGRQRATAETDVAVRVELNAVGYIVAVSAALIDSAKPRTGRLVVVKGITPHGVFATR